MRLHPKGRVSLVALRLSAARFVMACGLFACLPHLFAADAYTVLQKNCFPCHGSARTSGLDLRTAETALAGGMHGAVIVASDPEQSRLYKLITHVAEPAMPPGKRLGTKTSRRCGSGSKRERRIRKWMRKKRMPPRSKPHWRSWKNAPSTPGRAELLGVPAG